MVYLENTQGRVEGIYPCLDCTGETHREAMAKLWTRLCYDFMASSSSSFHNLLFIPVSLHRWRPLCRPPLLRSQHLCTHQGAIASKLHVNSPSVSSSSSSISASSRRRVLFSSCIYLFQSHLSELPGFDIIRLHLLLGSITRPKSISFFLVFG